MIEDRTIRIRELTYEILVEAGAKFIGYERLSATLFDKPGVIFVRYFNEDEDEVAYYCNGNDTAVIFGTPRKWGTPKPPLKKLSKYNWNC